MNIQTQLIEVPVTLERPLSEDTSNFISHPELARVHVAVTKECPNGSANPPKRSVLQQHVDFFDLSKDGVITMWETYSGFRSLGFNMILSSLAVPVIHPCFSLVTCPNFFDPFLRIYTHNIHKAKHGSDTGVYDTEGRFLPQKFEEIFSKWDRKKENALSFGDLLKMTGDLKCVMDPFGWFAAKFEWCIVWLLCADQHGRISKEDLRGVYDGSFFYTIAEKVKQNNVQ